MYMVSVYIEPKDILDKLSEEDKKRFNQCVFTDIVKDPYGGGVTIDCVLFNDENKPNEEKYRYRYSNDEIKLIHTNFVI